MKILVFSDSHHYISGMYCAIEAHHPDHVIHLGDFQEDAEEVARVYQQLPICMVPGNCDGWGHALEPGKKRIQLGGKSILLAHGHQWHVKQGYDHAIAEARVSGVDLLLFGHTHVPYCTQLADGLWVLNPGSCVSTYGVVTIGDGQLNCVVEQIP